MKKNQQHTVFKGIYEFEDPAGSLIAARIPHTGSADLFDNTAVLVRPNQLAVLIYKGQAADILQPGTHFIKTENVPLITRLANWKFGFRSPLRCEIWFFSRQVYLGRRWGTAKPVLHDFSAMKGVPLRAFGNYNVVLNDPNRFFTQLVGSKTAFDIAELDDFIQGQILEVLGEALSEVTEINRLGAQQDAVSKRLESLVNRTLLNYGLKIMNVQVLSLIPTDEILKALDAKAAMEVIGDKREYLLYKAANSLGELSEGKGQSGNDPMQMMLGLVLGKSLMASDFREKERQVLARPLPAEAQGLPAVGRRFCPNCGSGVQKDHKFCPSCGGKLSS